MTVRCLQVLALGCAIALGACDKAPQAGAPSAGVAKGAGGRGGAAIPVSVAKVVEQAMPVVFRTVGNVEPSSSVDVRSQLTGELLSVGFSEGQDVRAGQVLFTLESRPFENAVRQAEAVLARDTAQSKNTTAQLARYDDLIKRGLITRAEYDVVAANAASLQATLASDQAALETAKLQLQFTKIVAPVAGRTGALLVHPGALVRANDATPLVVINQLSPIGVAFSIPARMLPSVQGRGRDGLRLEARPSGAPADARVPTGVISFVDNSVDATTDTLRVKGSFPNADRRLWPGQMVDVTLQLALESRALVMPVAAVQTGQQGQFVFVVNDQGIAEVRPVTISRTDAQLAVVADGVRAGETVVTDGQLRLTPGAKISAQPPLGRPKSGA